MKSTTKNWIVSSNYDIKTADSLLKARRYIYVIFMCHLSIEKLLKAIVSETRAKTPPYTHDLYHLLKLTNLILHEKHREIIAHLNSASIPTRYPEDMKKMSREYTKSLAAKYLN